MQIDLFRPSVPPLSAYYSYLELIESNQIYSNFGPIHHKFKKRLADYFNIGEENIELFSSGTMALVAALIALQTINKDEVRPYCLLPSWTFVATVQSVIAAGLTPIFVDVEEQSMQLTKNMIEQVSNEILLKTSVVLVVSPFGAPLILEGYDLLCQTYGFEVLCDCAAGFESAKSFNFHTVISLHATKIFGIGEGGLLISINKKLIEYAKAYSNFGFLNSRKSITRGINGKFSEIQAAIGLAALDLWGSNKKDYYQKAAYYLEAAFNLPFQFQEGWGRDWVSSTCVIRFDDESQKKSVQKDWANNKIQTRDWWNQGCHLEPAFCHYEFINIRNNTNILAKTTLGIPFYKDISQDSINHIFK